MSTPESPLTKEQIVQFTKRIDARKTLFLDEIWQVLRERTLKASPYTGR